MALEHGDTNKDTRIMRFNMNREAYEKLCEIADYFFRIISDYDLHATHIGNIAGELYDYLRYCDVE